MERKHVQTVLKMLKGVERWSQLVPLDSISLKYVWDVYRKAVMRDGFATLSEHTAFVVGFTECFALLVELTEGSITSSRALQVMDEFERECEALVQAVKRQAELAKKARGEVS